MRTLILYVIHPQDGNLKENHKYMLRELAEGDSFTVVIINGSITDEGREYLFSKANEVIFRANEGYDAGAYKDYFLHNYEIIRRDFKQCILINDSFLGPLCPWETITEYMDMHAPMADFWGLSKWIAGYSEYVGKFLSEHIQSYFIFIRESLLKDNQFLTFWQGMNLTDTYCKAIENFEVRFTAFFSERGFTYTTWIENQSLQITIKEGDVIYLSHPDELIINYRFPVLKRKACTLENYQKMRNLFSCDVLDDAIKNTINKYYFECLASSLGYHINEMNVFVMNHKRVFIYGNGNYAHNVRCYLDDVKLIVEGHVTTSGEDGVTIKYQNLQCEENDGIIIAVNYKLVPEIMEMISNDWPELDCFIVDRRQYHND